jgi:hypothetical protein
MFDGAPIPPFPPGYEPPGPIYCFLSLFLGVLLLAECATFLLPEPWRYAIFRAVFDHVWPFSVVDRWINACLTGNRR